MSVLKRHKVALIGLIFGSFFLVLAQANSGSGDFTFETGAPITEGASAVELNDGRNSELVLPANYQKDTAIPLLINLHGYTGSGASQSSYTFMQQAASELGLAYIAPTGSEDNLGNNYWNATTACCNFNASDVDDVAYLDLLIERAQASANIDSQRIYLFGHSNGHFMAYSYLCSGSRKIAAVAGLAGAMDPDPSLCKASPNHILHIHGEKDGTINFNGGALFGNRYTSVAETISQWSTINSCSAGSERTEELLSSIPGEDAVTHQYRCKAGTLESRRIPAGIHTPVLDIEFAKNIVAWLIQFERQAA